MQIRNKFLIIGVFSFAVSLIIWSGVFSNFSFSDKIYDTWEVGNTNFKVKITAFKEKGVIPPGSYFVVESTPADFNKWHKIITIVSDENPPIPRNQIRFVSEHIGYIFMSSFYIVTTDGGKSWVIWDSEKLLPVEKFIRDYNLSPYIEEVNIKLDGTGQMKLRQQVKRDETGPELVTKDYGVNWKLNN